jgi:hypothetical protein
MRHLLHPVWADGVVASWTGPEHDDNDFRRSDMAVEVKTIRGDRPAAIRISSERQLDNPGGTRLFLVALAVDRHRQGAGESLPAMVEACRDMLNESVLGEFEDRLLAWGYSDTHRRRYEDTRYTLRTQAVYEVRTGFPRIVEDDLPEGIGGVSYHVSLDACRSFMVGPSVRIAELLGEDRGEEPVRGR